MIIKVLGASRLDVLWVSVVHYFLLAVFAAILATPLGIALAWILTMVLLDVEFTIDAATLVVVDAGAVLITGIVGAMTIFRALSSRPAMLLRQLDAE